MEDELTPLIRLDQFTSKRRIHLRHYDQVLEYIGDTGLWQWISIGLLWLPPIGGGIVVLLWSFTGLEPKRFRCSIPFCDGEKANYEDIDLQNYFQDLNDPNFCEKPIISFQDVKRYSKPLNCSDLFVLDYTQCTSDSRIIYDDFEFESTLVTELNLVCNDQFKVALVGTAYMVGLLFGSLIGSYPADRFGRKIMVFVFIAFGGIANLVGGFLNEYWSYLFFRFLCGVGEMGMVLVSFTLSVELVGARQQALIGNMNQLMFAVGECISGLLAYLIRDWRMLHYVSSALILPQLLLWWLVPESPRWLMSEGKWEKAAKVIKKAEKLNKRPLPKDLIIAEEAADARKANDEQHQADLHVSYMFTNPTLRIRTLIMTIDWTVAAFVYYGIGMSTTVLGGNIFINFIGAALAEIAGYIIAVFFSDHLGRKPVIILNFIISGIACVASGFVSDNSVFKLILVLIGKMGSSGAFSTAFVFTAELFPTQIRGTAVGMCSTIGRIGSIAAPQLAVYLPTLTFQALPLLIFGICGLFAGLVSFLLPETLGHPLPDTIAEAAQCSVPGQGKSMFSWWSNERILEEVEKQRNINKELELRLL